MIKQRRSTIYLCLLLSLPAIAQDKSLFEMDLDALLNVKINSVSRFSEPASEAIVPLTIIDKTAIQNSGAQNLKDLLTTWVPGMVFVQDQNEVNVAMRGIYSSAQQKILILLEGHRLNSRLISAANPDQSIGLDKIERIEIVRGPGSAAYGNVALTAVINIVLRKGNELNGGELSAGVGNFGQRTVSINWGQPIGNDGDLLLWSQWYRNDGERISVSPINDYARSPAAGSVDAIINGFFDKPAYDIGAHLQYDRWQILANSRRAHYVDPYTSANLTGEAYRYSDYPKRKGIGPGFQYTFHHFSVAYDLPLINEVSWKNRVYFDRSDMEATFVFNPAIQLFGQGTMYDRDYGIESELKWQQAWGSALLGYQYDEMEVYNSYFPFGAGGVYSGQLFDDSNPLVKPGKEDVQSVFGVIKYYMNTHWLVNFGVRHDIKHRLTLGDQVNTSPRLGLVYSKDDYFRLKTSFSESFVDAPYWNRYGALPTFRGSESLKPEKLRSLQITPGWYSKNGHWSYELNIFANRVSNFVFRNNAAAANEPINTNAGILESWGHEHQLSYQFDDWKIQWIGFFNHVIKVKNFAASNDEVFNIPNQTSNVIVDYRVNDQTSINLQLNYISDRLSPIDISLNAQPVSDPFPDQGVDYHLPNHRLPSVLLTNFNIGFSNVMDSPLDLHFSVSNLFDRQWQQGGTTIHPYQQPGRWWMLKASYHW